MRKEKNTHSTSQNQAPLMKVVDTTTDHSRLEFEIEHHVKSIRALIKRLRPLERQRYYDGLLAHILSQPVDVISGSVKNDSFDYCNLSVNDLMLIRELSVKMHELYRISENEMNC
jgi:hypothetical protein